MPPNSIVENQDGTFTLSDVPDGNCGDWHIKPYEDGWIAENIGGDQGFVYDETAWYASRTRVPRVFETPADAIAFFLGEPQVTT